MEGKVVENPVEPEWERYPRREPAQNENAMANDFYPFVDSGDPTPDNTHLRPADGEGVSPAPEEGPASTLPDASGVAVRYATRIAVYDDLLSTPRILIISPHDVRTYLEEITNTVYRCMREQGGRLSLMVIREIVENFIHAHFVEPIISILDDGNTVRFADQGPGIQNKERAFEFGVTSADREQKRYIRGTGAGFPMVQQYLENAGGAISIEDNLGQGTVVTVTVDAARAAEVEAAARRGAAVRGGREAEPLGAAPGEAGALASPQQVPVAQNPWYAPQQSWPATAAGWVLQQVGGMGYAAAPYPGPPAPAAGAWGYPPAPAYQPWQQAPTSAWPTVGAPGAAGAAMPAGNGVNTAAMPGPGGPYVTDRGRQAIAYLAEHGTCGPTELAAAFGSSNATWSRELEALTTAGLVTKVGQKRILTDMGRLWLQQQAGQ